VLSLFVSTTIQQCIITEPVTRILDLLFYGKAFIGVLTVAVQDADPTVCVLWGRLVTSHKQGDQRTEGRSLRHSPMFNTKLLTNLQMSLL
jgi:hypothetical protein